MKRIGLLISLVLLVSQCVQKNKVEQKTGRLFPDGVYTQNVRLQINLKNGEKRTFPFRSLTKVMQDDFEMMGLTPFGSKAFIAKGNFKEPDKTDLKFFMDLPKIINKKFLTQTFAQIQRVQSLAIRFL